MRELRPGCDHFDTPVPPDAAEARICSGEKTFCAGCGDGLMGTLIRGPS